MRKTIGYFILILVSGGIITLNLTGIIEDMKGTVIFFLTCICVLSFTIWATKVIKF